MVFASIFEQASSAFIFASTSSDQFCHASSEHFTITNGEHRAFRKVLHQLESLFIKTRQVIWLKTGGSYAICR